MEKLPADVPLFRKEVIDYKNDNVFGGVLLRQPRELAVLVGVCLAFIAALLVLVFVVDFTQRTRVTGWIESFPGPAKIAAPRAGVIERVRVQDGQLVEAGEVLLTITTGRERPEGGTAESEVISKLQQTADALRGRMESRKALLAHEQEQVRKDVKVLERDIAGTRDVQRLAQERLTVAEAELARQRQLADQGLVAKSALGAALEAVLRAKQDAKEIDSRLRDAERSLAKMKASSGGLELQATMDMGELSSRLSALEQSIITTTSEDGVAVVAAIGGRVTALDATAGDSVAAGQTLLAVTPTDAKLQAHLLVPTRAAAFLMDGALIKLQYDAFPYQKFGQYEAVITAISGTVLSPEDQRGVLRTRDPVYRVIAELRDAEVTAYGKSYELRPGLTLAAEISGDRQTIFQKITEPLYHAAAGDRS